MNMTFVVIYMVAVLGKEKKVRSVSRPSSYNYGVNPSFIDILFRLIYLESNIFTYLGILTTGSGFFAESREPSAKA
jgi:hypothetical protein